MKIVFGNYYSLRLFWKINYMDNFLLAVRSRRLSINIILRKKEQKKNRKRTAREQKENRKRTEREQEREKSKL